ncbi:MAG: tetratricopeptide repeat-containing serine/threonine-protein kinase [Planctomycetales bacterium]|nr:tetratricopeptide repeat-containing serine/threonine-protein kinase [Planctomycetales bacterium]
MRPGPYEVVAERGRSGEINREGVYLADFGLAKSVAAGSTLTRTGQALGTPAYMSPEQGRGETSSLTPATDVWGVGCVLYEMLAGCRPFGGETPAALVAAIVARSPASLRRSRPDVPRAVTTLLDAALAKDPGSRPRDGAALRDDLDRVVRGAPPLHGASPARTRALIAALLVVAAAGAVLAWPRGTGIPPRTPAPSEGPPTPVLAAGPLAARARAVRFEDPRRAVELLAAALESEPSRHDWRLERGLLLWGLGEGEAARSEWDRIPAEAPGGGRARLYRGLEPFFRSDDRVLHGPEGRRDLEQAAPLPAPVGPLARGALAALDRDWAAARAGLAGVAGWEAALLRGYVESFDPAGDRAAALRDYGAALEEGIPFAWVHSNRGVVRSLSGDLRGAEEDFDRALALRPGFGVPLVGRAGVRRKRGDLRGSIADCDAALAAEPGFPEALLNRGITRGEAGEFAGARDDLTAALERRPGWPDPRAYRARARSALGDHEGAVEDATEGLRSFPDAAWLFSDRGCALLDLGRYEEAARDLREVTRLSPGEPNGFGNLGRALRALGDWAGAAAAFRELLRLAPGHPRADEVRRWREECEENARAEEGGG